MAKKNRNDIPARRKAAPEPPVPVREEDGVGKKGRLILLAALVLAAAGYVLLKYADPAGSGLCAGLSPFFLLAGYFLVPAALCASPSSSGSADK